MKRSRDELEDLFYQSQEIQDTMSRSFAIQDDVDEEELEAGMRLTDFADPAELAMLDELDLEEPSQDLSYLNEPELPAAGAKAAEPQAVAQSAAPQ